METTDLIHSQENGQYRNGSTSEQSESTELHSEPILTPEQQAAFDRLCALGFVTTHDRNLHDVFGNAAGVDRDRVYDPEYGWQLFGGHFTLLGNNGPFGDMRDATAQLVFKWIMTGDPDAFEALADGYADQVLDHEIEQVRRELQYKQERQATIPGPQEKRKSPPRAGYIYVIQAGDHYKIGQTKLPKNRAKTHQTSNPLPVEEIFLVHVDDMTGAERALHKLFADKRGKGEWFTLDDADLETIRDYLGIEPDELEVDITPQ